MSGARLFPNPGGEPEGGTDRVRRPVVGRLAPAANQNRSRWRARQFSFWPVSPLERQDFVDLSLSVLTLSIPLCRVPLLADKDWRQRLPTKISDKSFG